jgi:pyruvate-formate lyase
LGLQKYLLNYAELAETMASKVGKYEKASHQSLSTIAKNMRHLAHKPPVNFHQGVQLILSVFITLHISGEVVSIGRVDYALRKWGKAIDPHAKSYEVDEHEQ